MHARDVMVAPVITVKPSTTVKEVAELFLENPISAAPDCQTVRKNSSALSAKATYCTALRPAQSDIIHGGLRVLSIMTRWPPNMSKLTATKFQMS